jgi:hypothetical protein
MIGRHPERRINAQTVVGDKAGFDVTGFDGAGARSRL